MKKVKVIWSYSTAAHVAATKEAKYGMPFEVVAVQGGGFQVVPGATVNEAILAMTAAEQSYQQGYGWAA